MPIDHGGNVVVRRQLRRQQMLKFFAQVPPCIIGIEACGTAHYWARELSALGHDVRMMPPAYVKPYVKRQKNDAADAEAICEAVMRPTMRFVPVKSVEQGNGDWMLNKTLLPQSVAREIQGMIQSGQLKAGEKIPSQREFSEKFGISRASLREALLTLETLRLLKTEAGRGTFVAAGDGAANRPQIRLDSRRHRRAPLSGASITTPVE